MHLEIRGLYRNQIKFDIIWFINWPISFLVYIFEERQFFNAKLILNKACVTSDRFMPILNSALESSLKKYKCAQLYHFVSDVLDTVNFLPYSILHREQKQSPIVLQAHGLWLFIPLNHTLDKDPCLQMCGLSSELNCRVERSAYSLLCCTEFIYPRMNKNWHRFQKKHFGKILIFSNIIVRGKIWKFDFRFKICRCSKIFTDLYFLSVNCTFHLFSSRRFYFILLINNIIVKLNTKKKN